MEASDSASIFLRMPGDRNIRRPRCDCLIDLDTIQAGSRQSGDLDHGAWFFVPLGKEGRIDRYPLLVPRERRVLLVGKAVKNAGSCNREGHRLLAKRLGIPFVTRA